MLPHIAISALLLLHTLSFARICGEHGYTQDVANYIGDEQRVSLGTCRQWCADMNSARHTVCRSYGHNAETNLCSFAHNSLETLRFVPDRNRTTIFYDIGCFPFNETCDYSSHTNLLNNAGFNVSPKLIGPWEGEYAVKEGHVLFQPFQTGNDNKELVFLGSQDVHQYRGLCTDVHYKASLDYMVENLAAGYVDGNIEIFFGNCLFDAPFNQSSGVPGKWYHFECSVRGGDGSARGLTANGLNLDGVSNMGGYETEFHWANIRLEQIPPAYSIETVGPSFITNGGFETGTYLPWEIMLYKAPNITYEILSPGLPAMQGIAESNYKFGFVLRTGTLVSTFSIVQTLNAPLTLGKSYLLTFECQVFESGGFYVNLADYVWDYSTLFSYFTNKTRVYSHVFTGSGKVEQLQFQFMARLFDNYPVPVQNITGFLDNVSIREIS